jgi:integrase
MPTLAWPEFTAAILALYAPPLRAPITRSKMAQVLRELGAWCRTSADLTPATIAAYATAYPKRVPNTTRGLLAYTRAAARIALAAGWLDRDPFAARKTWIRPEPANKTRHHSAAELAQVWAHLEHSAPTSWHAHRLFALFATVSLTGLRRNEALYLTPADCDLPGRILTVNPRRRLKTSAAAAPVPLPEALARVLELWIPRAGTSWVFPTRGLRTPWTGGSPGKKPLDRLRAAGQAVGVEGLTFASLRHSWATHAESLWGLPELLVQRVLRHTTTTTQRHYRHADLANLRDSVKTLRFDSGDHPWHGRSHRPPARGESSERSSWSEAPAPGASTRKEPSKP